MRAKAQASLNGIAARGAVFASVGGGGGFGLGLKSREIVFEVAHHAAQLDDLRAERIQLDNLEPARLMQGHGLEANGGHEIGDLLVRAFDIRLGTGDGSPPIGDLHLLAESPHGGLEPASTVDPSQQVFGLGAKEIDEIGHVHPPIGICLPIVRKNASNVSLTKALDDAQRPG